MAFPKHSSHPQNPAGSCLDFGQDKVPAGQVTRGCRRAVMEQQLHVPLKVCKREKKLSPLTSTGKATLLPSRICPSSRRLRQRRCSCCILLLSLAEDGLKAMELHAGQVSSAQLPCSLLLLLLLPTAYISFQPMAFTFFWSLGSCSKSYNRLDFNL